MQQRVMQSSCGSCRKALWTQTRLVDRHTVHVGVVHEPDDLVAEKLAVVLRATEKAAARQLISSHGEGRTTARQAGCRAVTA